MKDKVTWTLAYCFEMRTQNASFENVTANEHGIVPGHAYTITDIQIVELRKGRKGQWPQKRNSLEETAIRLLRIRNPWANEKEWNGDWSDK